MWVFSEIYRCISNNIVQEYVSGKIFTKVRSVGLTWSCCRTKTQTSLAEVIRHVTLLSSANDIYQKILNKIILQVH